MKIKRKRFSFSEPARVYAWFLRRFGYETKIEEWSDQFPSGWLWAFEYEVIAKKGEKIERINNVI